MFGYIKGIVDEIGLDYAIIDVNGIGFKMSTSKFTNQKIKIGESAKLYTKMNVREDDISLLGFYDKRELKIFEQLIFVSKVGPKLAYSILSTYDVDSLTMIILQSDINTLSKASGVGKKTAERIIVELRDKLIKNNDVNMNEENNIIFEMSNSKDEAIEVLLSLGFNKSEIMPLVDKLYRENKNVDTNELVKSVLARLSKI